MQKPLGYEDKAMRPRFEASDWPDLLPEAKADLSDVDPATLAAGRDALRITLDRLNAAGVISHGEVTYLRRRLEDDEIMKKGPRVVAFVAEKLTCEPGMRPQLDAANELACRPQ